MTGITLLLIAVTFSVFVITNKLFFVIVNKIPFKMHCIILVGVLGIIYNVYGIYHAQASVITLLMYLAALALFFWALFAVRRVYDKGLSVAYSDDVPEILVRVGPYHYIRNPFYTTYLLAYLAPFFTTYDPVALIILALLYVFYLDAAKQEEDKFRNSPLADEYAAFFKQTGRFLPRYVSIPVRFR